MSNETLQFVLQVVAIFMGGGAVQMFLAFLRRKPESRKLNTASDVDLATVEEKRTTAQDKLIDQLQEDGETNRDNIRRMEEKLQRMEERSIAAQRDFAERLGISNAENAQLVTRVAQLTTDLNICHRQLDDYRDRHRLGGI